MGRSPRLRPLQRCEQENKALIKIMKREMQIEGYAGVGRIFVDDYLIMHCEPPSEVAH